MIQLAVFVLLLFSYALVSRRLEQTILTAPIVFTLAGMFMFPALPTLLEAGFNANVFLRLAEIGLVLLLFTDASRTDFKLLRSIGNLPIRLLSTGMLLTIFLGTVAARLVFPELSLWEAAILAAILAPTDAGLGQVIVNSERVPTRIRQALNVEAGLNDGLSVPFLLFFMALAEAKIEGGAESLARFIGEQLGLGLVVGLGIGLIGGWLLGWARRRNWVSEPFRQIGVVALPLLCLVISEMIGASMFIAAFAAGLTVQMGFKDVGLAAVHYDDLAVRGPQPDGGANGSGRDSADGYAPESGQRGVYGLVRSAGVGVHRVRTGVPGGGNVSAWRKHDSAGGDCDRGA
jgi:NhaP-type Na+/H+ or K+/H+ antiporter